MELSIKDLDSQTDSYDDIINLIIDFCHDLK